MKASLVRFALSALLLASLGSNSWGSDQRISVPPNFTAPQEQASELGTPGDAPAPLKTVITIVMCNKVVGLIGVDETGEVRGLHFTTKEQITTVQKAVPADHDFDANLGCPGNVAKDVTVL